MSKTDNPCYYWGQFARFFPKNGINIPAITWTDTTRGIVGTRSGDDAAAGYVGEYAIQGRTFTNRAAMTNATTMNVTASPLLLTPGDWDIGASVTFTQSNGTSVTILDASISKTSGVLSANDTISFPTAGESRVENNYVNFVATATSPTALVVPDVRASISVNTNFYLTAFAAFTVSALECNGSIWARRRR